MADRPEDEASLEMPSFSLRRTKGRPADPAEPASRAPRVSLPVLPPRVAVPITGAAVGALAVLLTWLSTAACDAVRGTSSCGGGPGFLVMVAVLVVLGYAGTLLLGALGVPDAGSTSVLAVGITAVLVMLVLLDSIYDGWMVIAIPVVAAISYVGSWWITTAVIEDD